MAEKLQKLIVVTPSRVAFTDEVRMVIARGAGGDLGILPDHAPLITSLKTDVVRIQKDGQWRYMAVSNGFLEVKNNRVVIVADSAELAEEIDVERARRAKERAEERLRTRAPEIDILRAEAALMRALARLKAVELAGGPRR
ncbi:F0F1 ATP synthase subunit epsilon [Thermodesulfitimonas autotrophica]|uniref:ATP synthase epsilon chain n=1 Tax=Thermodesulfitimonas autotrophica TaxID=1894989 RepID=A0A3N5BB98_9THEO|nr:F0F1 ATP synthase subunit epsilon [Thermodesulfitimonas autotrophica]RPF42975.1 ATP synthase F1 subcomplex epsilon subunit [Thermodesulfitimonas autotrophica]